MPLIRRNIWFPEGSLNSSFRTYSVWPLLSQWPSKSHAIKVLFIPDLYQSFFEEKHPCIWWWTGLSSRPYCPFTNSSTRTNTWFDNPMHFCLWQAPRQDLSAPPRPPRPPRPSPGCFRSCPPPRHWDTSTDLPVACSQRASTNATHMFIGIYAHMHVYIYIIYISDVCLNVYVYIFQWYLTIIQLCTPTQ